MPRYYISPKIIVILNSALLIISVIFVYFFNFEINHVGIELSKFIPITLLVIAVAVLFKYFILKYKEFSITDHWIESIKLHLLLISSVGQEIFFRGILTQILGIYLSALVYTFWNFFPNKKRVGVIIFFFFLGLLQTHIYLYTNNIFYVIYSNFLFHVLIRMLKFRR